MGIYLKTYMLPDRLGQMIQTRKASDSNCAGMMIPDSLIRM